MKHLLTILALAATASAQTYITVTADTNRVIRTNFSLVRSQVSDLSGASFAISNITGLQTALDGKLATNGSAAGLSNFPASLVTTNGSAAGLTNFPSDLLRTNGDGSGLTNLPNANLTNATGVLPIANGGTGATNASAARAALELGTAATNDATAFQAASTNLTALASGDGSSLTNVTITDASTLTNFPAELLRTNGDASGLTNIAVYPSLTNNASKVLAVTTNETGVEWVTVAAGGLPETPLAISNGGTGGTNTTNAFISLGVYRTNAYGTSIQLGPGADGGDPYWQINGGGIAIGRSSSANGYADVAIGTLAKSISANGVAVGGFSSANGGTAVGAYATNYVTGFTTTLGRLAKGASGVTIGHEASSHNQPFANSTNLMTFNQSHGVTIGHQAKSSGSSISIGKAAAAFGNTNVGSIQLGTGTNNTIDSIQIYDAGTVDTNEWARIAALSTYPTTNISVVGTNNTNTLVFSNGILVEVQ